MVLVAAQEAASFTALVRLAGAGPGAVAEAGLVSCVYLQVRRCGAVGCGRGGPVTRNLTPSRAPGNVQLLSRPTGSSSPERVGDGDRQTSPSYLPKRSLLCAPFCDGGGGITHWLASEDLSAPPASSFLHMRSFACCYFLFLLLPLNLRGTPGFCQAFFLPSASVLTRQAGQEAVGLVAFNAATALPTGMR